MRIRITIVTLVALIVLACAYTARAQTTQAARPGEILLVLDDTALIRATAVRYGTRRLSIIRVGSQDWQTLEAGNGYVYSAQTRVIIGDSRLSADGFEGT